MKTMEPSVNDLGAVFIARREELRRVACRLVESSELAEDVLQDSYLKLIQRRSERMVQNPFGYCCQVVRNTALDHGRRHAVELGVVVPLVDGELPEVPGGVPPCAALDHRRTLEHVEAILGNVSERARQVFEHYRLNGCSRREIALQFGVSVTRVNNLIKDVRIALASCRDAIDGY